CPPQRRGAQRGRAARYRHQHELDPERRSPGLQPVSEARGPAYRFGLCTELWGARGDVAGSHVRHRPAGKEGELDSQLGNGHGYARPGAATVIVAAVVIAGHGRRVALADTAEGAHRSALQPAT